MFQFRFQTNVTKWYSGGSEGTFDYDLLRGIEDRNPRKEFEKD